MGIDRKDVRIVCHFNIPKSMEAFYQESGRAGRDQLSSTSLLYYGIDDRKRMEFILSKSGSNKSQSSSSQEESSERSLADFNQMVEYSEGSGCRRKKILECFGEQVTASLCGKSCDACRHPNLIARCLEDVAISRSLHQKNNSSGVFIASSTGGGYKEQVSEFWNHDEEASGTDEDISDSDDGSEIVNNLTGSKSKSRLGVNEKIALLQQAEEKFYRNENADKQRNKVDKNAISDTMRGASREKLRNSLKWAQQRLHNLKIEVESSATLLEDECYKKYGKVGKSFYYSQVASTVRWLSTTNSTDLISRLQGTSGSSSMMGSSEAQNPLTTLTLSDPSGKEGTDNETADAIAELETSPLAVPIESPSAKTKLTPIPSFSEFVNSSRKVKGDQIRTKQEHSPRVEKRSRLS